MPFDLTIGGAPVEFFKILILCVLASIVYGIPHDLITTRICIEYFTIAHPPVWNGTKAPTLLAFTWGVIATWWMGAILGIFVAASARVGSLPKRSAFSLIQPVAWMLPAMALCAFAAGLWGFFQTETAPRIASYYGIAPALARRFYADACAHLASYASGALAALALCVWIFIRRLQAARRASTPRS